MNFLAIPTLKNVRACLRLPSSMMPRFSLKLTLARLRTGIARVGSLLFSAAVITRSATLMSFFSTGPVLLAFSLAMGSILPRSALRARLALRRPSLRRLALRGPQLPGGPARRPLAAGRGLGRPARLGRALPAGRRLRLGCLYRARLRGGGVSRVARQDRRLPLGALRGDDDRVRETLRSALAAEDLVGAGAAGALERDPLQLGLGLLLRQPAALEAGAGLDDLLDVEVEDVTPTELALGPLAPAQEHAEAPAALLQRELDLLPDLVVVGDRFLGLAGEGDPHRGHVDEHHHGPGGQGAAGLGDAVVLPRGLDRGLEGRARRLLVEERHPVGVTDHARQLVVVVALLALREGDHRRLPRRRHLVRALAVGEPRLDGERIAAVHRGGPRHRGVELPLDLLVEAVEDRLLADGRDAVRGRRHDLGRLDGLVERLRGRPVDVARPGVRREPGGLADLLGHRGRDPAEVPREEPGERVAPGVVEHAQQDAELDAVGMRLDLA